MEKAKQASRKINFKLDGKSQASKQKDKFSIRWKKPSKQKERLNFNQMEKAKQANRKMNFQLDGKGQASKILQRAEVRVPWHAAIEDGNY